MSELRPIVLVHGAWHGGSAWRKLASELHERGLVTLALDLPGHGASPLPLDDLHGDSAYVANVVRGFGEDVVLVGHSYGGAVITEASAGCSNVAHLVYVAAYCIPAGMSVMAQARSGTDAGDLGAAMQLRDDGMIALDPERAVPALYAGCDQDDIDESLAHLGLQPAVTFQQEVTAAGWETIPSTYVQCTEDRAVPHEIQRVMAARCTSTVEFPTNHSPFLTMVSELAGVVERAAQAGGS